MDNNICNICGANYIYKNGHWVCSACDAIKPMEISNEEDTLLYAASQKLRMASFDEAEEMYADIYYKYPQNANAYWGHVLSKYCIKYEQDYDGKMLPTCYATNLTSFLDDVDYKKVLELTSGSERAYFEEQAKKIEDIRIEWAEKAKKEQPYDVFICYKDTDLSNNVDRTKDSYEAYEIYTQLVKAGYKVFYSRESLKDKVGELKYEPYIYNALDTAKVMVVYSSSSDVVTSTWMKNEWQRYYKLIQKGQKKDNSLVVIYNGFNPSDLPRPLSVMQCMDKTSITFLQDLLSKIKSTCDDCAKSTKSKKVEKTEKKEDKSKEKTTEQKDKTKKKKKSIFDIKSLVAIILSAVIILIIYFCLYGKV